jgi:hypothetical protein
MMILKTNRLKKFLACLAFLGVAENANALEAFECVRDLMPITSAASFQGRRKGVEKPFMLTPEFMAFPEVSNRTVTGFYVYSSGHAWYYDSIEDAEKATKSLAELRRTNEFSLFSLVAQPLGLETVTLSFMPGFGSREVNGGGPVILGSSVLPVVGAMLSRPNEQLSAVYRNPAELGDKDLKRWVGEHSSRRPAMANAIELDHRLAHLTTRKAKAKTALWAPLLNEIDVRKIWIKNHNIDEQNFKILSRLMETVCKP